MFARRRRARLVGSAHQLVEREDARARWTRPGRVASCVPGANLAWPAVRARVARSMAVGIRRAGGRRGFQVPSPPLPSGLRNKSDLP
ncbi:hypothetical protein GUJ93_ZPchr0009g1238 [Zizania palustris]|uniref:Uncharacterized protein n=1 Tax=Zizania palustris TaxID=103762 RepID=A0A8J5VKH6_ZIZPA|nr:hypothetical protein GUJ93_ZPchr0009g1238 [Zizania palustris]